MKQLQFLYNNQIPSQIVVNIGPERKAKYESYVIDKVGMKMEFVLGNNGYCHTRINGNKWNGIIKGSEQLLDAVMDGDFDNKFSMTFSIND